MEKVRIVVGCTIAGAAFVIVVILATLYVSECLNRLEDKTDLVTVYTKPEVFHTVEDYQKRIAEDEAKLRDIYSKKWLKVSDIQEVLEDSSSCSLLYISRKEWDKLLSEKTTGYPNDVIHIKSIRF